MKNFYNKERLDKVDTAMYQLPFIQTCITYYTYATKHNIFCLP